MMMRWSVPLSGSVWHLLHGFYDLSKPDATASWLLTNGQQKYYPGDPVLMPPDRGSEGANITIRQSSAADAC